MRERKAEEEESREKEEEESREKYDVDDEPWIGAWDGKFSEGYVSVVVREDG